MAITASLTISGSVGGLSTGSKTIGPITISPASPTDISSGQTQTLVLANGDNTITVPSTTCTAAVITFGAASTTTKKLKGVGGDTGITVTKVGTCVLQFDAAAAPASFIINSSALDTGNTTEIVFI